MFSKGNFNSQSGQPPPPPRLQNPSSQLQVPLPPSTNNFRQPPLLPLPQVPPRPGQPGLPMYQHASPHAPHFNLRQVPPPPQPYLQRPATAHGNPPLPNMYMNAPHPYLSSGQPRSLPIPSQGQTLYRPPVLTQFGGVPSSNQIPRLPPSVPTNVFPTSSPSGSTVESTIRNSQMSSMGSLPATSLPSSSLPSMPPSIHYDSKLVAPPPTKPSGEIVQKIEELCQLIAKNGPSYEDIARQKEIGNPSFKFLFGGEPGTEAAASHEYFLWMKNKYNLKGIGHAVTINHSAVAIESHSPDDSDMEMEDDITRDDAERATNMPFKGLIQATVLKSGERGEKQVDSLANLGEYEAADNELSSGSLRLGEQENFATLRDDQSSSKIAEAAEGIRSDKYPGQLMNGSSPFRLLQNYASNDSSDNDDSNLKNANSESVSSIVAVSTEYKSPYNNKEGFGLPSNPELLLDSKGGVMEKVPTVTSGLTTKDIDAKQNHLSTDHAVEPKHREAKDRSAKGSSNTQKTDKFGRLIREGVNDSDSDESRHARRRSSRKGRSRSRSRSRSPITRKRRSPRRRRENRSRSRSWSPRNRRNRSKSPRNRKSRSRSPRSRRSRSRSPPFRHASSMTRDSGKMQICFDFLKGRCHRGALCRFVHDDSEKNDGSKHHKGKQQVGQLNPSSKNGNIYEDEKKLSQKLSENKQEIMNRGMEINHDAPVSCILSAKDDVVLSNREGSNTSVVVDSNKLNSRTAGEVAAKVLETSIVQRSENVTPCVDETSKVEFASLKDSAILQSQSVPSHSMLEDTNQAEETNDSSISDSSPDKTSTTFLKNHASEALPTLTNLLHNPSHISPLSHFAPNSGGAYVVQGTEVSKHYNLIPRTVASQSQSAPLGTVPPYMFSSQSSLSSIPPNSSSGSLPPPPLFPPPTSHVQAANASTAQLGVPLQFQQSYFPRRSDFASQVFPRPLYSTELSSNSHVSEFQLCANPVLQQLYQPFLYAEDFKLKPLPGSNPSSQQFGSVGVFGEDGSKQRPMHGLGVLGSSIQTSNYSQPQELLAAKRQPFPGESLTPGETLKSSSQISPQLQHQQLPHDLHQPGPDCTPAISSLSGYPPNQFDRTQSSHLSVFGGPRSSSHFNPYASTFEKPLSSKFSSDVFRHLSHASVDVQDVGSRQETSSLVSTKGTTKVVPGSSGDQYDPLLDSIEPSPNLCEKSDHIQKQEPFGDSMRLKGSNHALDVEENRKKDAAGITPAMSPDNEEFGETADAEVGDVEDGTQSGPDALANTNMGEIEIDQIKSSEKSKNDKESRSMKLFKACLADFVKEVLKPSWRQGNMSKETFKTVVKKTVDKVAGAMKKHHMPKSKAKINHYIESSERKLRKLVMGYVDKYAKG